jgi:hypothetical protein
MTKKYIITLASVFFLSISSALADTEPKTKNSDANVEAIIAEIEKAKKNPQGEKTATAEKTQAQAKESRDVSVTIPAVPSVPKPVQVTTTKLVDESGEIIYDAIEKIAPPRQKPRFTNRVAPERFRKNKKDEKKEALPGDIKNARVTAYLHAPLMDAAVVQKKLEEAGFEVLTKFNTEKKGKVVSLVYTSPAMQKAAAKDTRGFAGTLRVVVDQKNKLVNISNPIYVMKAFMQKEYDAKVAEETLKKIRSVFPELKESTEVVKFLALERYRFMENMPYYQDMKVVKKGKNADLLKKAKKSKKVVYEQKLENGSIIVGVELGKRTSKFVKKIGYQNSGLLPYPILIEKGEAKILAPQYYIAVMYPMLKMSKFMTIATVPGAITKDIDKIFR